MGGKMSRTKGASAERELFKLLNAKLGRDLFRRNLTQTRDSGCDDGGASVFAMEVKRQEQLNIPAWIAQAVAQAKPGQIPVLAYRRSREPWRFLIISDLHMFADLFDVIAGT